MKKRWMAVVLAIVMLSVHLSPVWEALAHAESTPEPAASVPFVFDVPAAQTDDPFSGETPAASEHTPNESQDITASFSFDHNAGPSSHSAEPTSVPTEEPVATAEPTSVPTEEPVVTAEPTSVPTEEPVATAEPTSVPTEEPVVTAEPTAEPTEEPVVTAEPTAVPTEEPVVTAEPTSVPTEEPVVTAEPTAVPTEEPVVTAEPTAEPTEEPVATAEPTAEPTEEPVATAEPTAEPTEEPVITAGPTSVPTEEPVVSETPTVSPEISAEPSATPTASEVPAADVLTVNITASPSYLMAGDGSVFASASVQGGLGDYTVTLQIYSPYSLASENTFTLTEPGSVSLSCVPAYGGTYTARVCVTDASGQAAEARASITVSEGYPETPADWARSIAGVQLTGDWHTDLVAIARTQIGYTEYDSCFIEDASGEHQSYTRYGHWFGSPYQEWCAMFVAFCLHYAGIPDSDYPTSAGCTTWRNKLQAIGAYEDDEDTYQPVSGDLVFFTHQGEEDPQHIGIVEQVADGKLYTIEGNTHKAVRRKEYALTDENIIGYGSTAAVAAAAGRMDGDLLPVIPVDDGTIGLTTLNNVNMREQPSVNSTFLLQISDAGTAVSVLHSVDFGGVIWYRAEYNGVTGYIRGDLLSLEKPETAPDVSYYCGAEEHIHSESCADADGVIVCGFAEHVHDEACLIAPEPTPDVSPEATAEPVRYCGAEEHIHSESCADADGVFICGLDEHVHDEACLIAPEPTPDVSPEATAEPVRYCGAEEHIHSEACADADGVIVCGFAEHVHDEACLIVPEITPEVSPEATAEPVRYCGAEEHIHSESCADADGVIVCGLDEHVHDEACLIVPEITPEPTPVPVLYCGLEEHAHAENCADENGSLICLLTEHMHTEECLLPTPLDLQLVLTPTSAFAGETLVTLQAQVEGGAAPYAVAFSYSAPEAEAVQPAEPEIMAISEEAEDDPHSATLSASGETAAFAYEPAAAGTHTLAVTATDALGMQAQAVLSLQVAAGSLHETEADFLASISAAGLTGDLRADVVAIARTQLGYTESTTDFVVDNGQRRGYTRYGAWAESPYMDWNAPFVQFSLHYAGLAQQPAADAAALAKQFSAAGQYRDADACTPLPGDVVFFDWEEDGVADHSGIVAEGCESENGYTIVTIEGDVDGAVITRRFVPSLTPSIVGYAQVCEAESSPAVYCGLKEHTHASECFDEAGWLLCALDEHTHTIVCTVDLSDLRQEDRELVKNMILQIEEMPSADEIDAQIEAFEEAEDYEGEELWLTDVYQQVARVYSDYSSLPETLQQYVFNRDKLLELEYIWSMVTLADVQIAKTTSYQSSMFNDKTALFVLYVQSGNTYYAFDGDGNAVQIKISGGNIYADEKIKDNLLWSFESQGNNSYLIRNAGTGRYLHIYSNNNGADTGVTTAGAYSSSISSRNNVVRITSNSAYAQLNTSSKKFVRTTTQNSAAQFQFGVTNAVSVWLDGTNGGIMGLLGSPDERVSAALGATITLPSTWDSPKKYHYTLRGWYDIVNHRYYAPGTQYTVQGNTVLYADWVAASYNVGQSNGKVSNTISTNDFITTRVFDYSSMFNMYSLKSDVSVTAAGHTETWTLVTNGTVPHNNGSTLNFAFLDYDANGDISYSNNKNTANTNQGTKVTTGLYNASLAQMLFSTSNSFDPQTGSGVLGKQYIGKADHLYHYGTNPSDENYGYYYYDSRLNAASYNQSAQRFYVYDYLERTTDSQKDRGGGEYSDFLPFNSPNVNINGQTVRTYSYSGDNQEYSGTTHYMYDAKYEDKGGPGCTPNYAGTNYWFGMSSEIQFYLPNKPGTKDKDGNFANQSLYGEHLTFEFSGDDDVWILVDGTLVLDIGGMHGILGGEIDFSTGTITRIGSTSSSNAVRNVTYLEPGDHTLTLYYLERGSSQSNCRIRFNITPRYSLTIQKEDDKTGTLLNGAEFSVYTDQACTQPAQLWSNSAARSSDEFTNVFSIVNGKATMWGFVAGHTYYIKETKAPTDGGYDLSNGIIVMELNNVGSSTYEVIPDPKATGKDNPTPGFTVKSFRVDQENQEAYLVVTNPRKPVELTSVQVEKEWADAEEVDHSGTPVTVRLLADGELIREVTLNDDNGWKHRWDDLPRHGDDGVTPIDYTVEEIAVEGYDSEVELVESTAGNEPGTGNETPPDFVYRITNTPIEVKISLTVTKVWRMDGRPAEESIYELLAVPVKVLANGEETGLTATLSSENDWTTVFTDLDNIVDEDGNLLYTVVEDWQSINWKPEYGPIMLVNGSQTEYETTITNVYNYTYELPESGGPGAIPYTAGGMLLIAAAGLQLYLQTRRRREDSKV